MLFAVTVDPIDARKAEAQVTGQVGVRQKLGL